MDTTNNTPQNAPAVPREYLTLTEAAELLGVTRRFLERRIDDGEISVFKPSSRLVRLRRVELERWVDRCTRRRTTESEVPS